MYNDVTAYMEPIRKLALEMYMADTTLDPSTAWTEAARKFLVERDAKAMFNYDVEVRYSVTQMEMPPQSKHPCLNLERHNRSDTPSRAHSTKNPVVSNKRTATTQNKSTISASAPKLLQRIHADTLFRRRELGPVERPKAAIDSAKQRVTTDLTTKVDKVKDWYVRIQASTEISAEEKARLYKGLEQAGTDGAQLLHEAEERAREHEEALERKALLERNAQDKQDRNRRRRNRPHRS